MTGPKLIEVALPLPEINDASSYDKMPGIGPHPKGIHHWWARLPLPVTRAVLFASVVDDPSAHPERFPTEEAQAAERERLFGIIRRLMQKQIHKHPELYAEARAEMLKYCEGTLPPVLDPFAGGGSIPLEAARLGFEAHAGDLNPIAVLLNKCNLELVPRWAGWPPVNPQDRPFLRTQSPSSLGARTSRPQGVHTSHPAHPPAAQTPLPPDLPVHAPHLPHVVPLDAEASSPPHAQASESQPAGRPHKFWHSRGYLPHLDQPGLIQAITFRLHDAVPVEVVAAWKAELGLASGETASADRAAALRRRLAQYEDAGHGACWLRDQRLASLVEDALLHFDGQRYRLLAWCIMPNHVHVLIETRHGWPVPDVVHSWKSFTAKQANRLLQREGPFWMPDYYDRYIRDDLHLAAAIAYIENNPVKAGLVERPEEWRFSSAHARRAGGSGASIGGAVSLSGEQPSSAAGAGRGEPGASETLAIPAKTTPLQWQGAAGLAADVRYYGKVILERARQKIGHLYPMVTVTAEMAEGRPDLQPYVGKELPVIAWIWARTVASPNPALRGLHVPLMSTFWLSSQKGKEAWLEPVVEWADAPGNSGSSPGVRGGRDDRAVGHGGQSGQDDRAGESGQDDRAPRSDDPVGASPATHSDPSDPSGNARVPPATPGNLPRWRFAVRTRPPADRAAVRAGTKTGKATFRCLLTGDAITDDYIKAEGQAGRLGMRLVAIVAEGTRGKAYLPAVPEHEQIARQAEPEWKPDAQMPDNPRWFSPPLVGLRTYGDLFTPRQLVALTTLSDLVREIRDDVRRDALAAGLSPQDAEAYMATVVTFLALIVDRCADHNNMLCTWNHFDQVLRNLFKRQAIPMVWDFAEANIVEEVVGGWITCVMRTESSIKTIQAITPGHSRAIDAASPWDSLRDVLVSTDPPYYDNIGYAALSDFFYVWLRRTIGDLYPDLFATILVPKEPELVAAPERFDGDRRQAKEHFETGFRQAFTTLREKMDPRFPLTVYYAFKQDDEESGADEEANTGNGAVIDRTTGWETMLEAMIGTGFQITATWPVRCAQKWRQNAMGTNTLASYIVLACRPRPEDAPQTDRRSFIAALKRELPAALRHLQQGNIAPVDFAQAAIGPGMAIFSRYSRVVEASGRPMTVRTALALINQTLTEVLTEQEDEFDNDTRWAIAWFEQHGFAEGDFGEAELLSKAKATSVSGMVEAGIARSRAGKVRLLRSEELPADWDPERDRRLTVWEMTHHLLRVYYHEKRGEAATAELLRKLGSRGELARELAYRLFDISERKKRSQEAQAYNALVLGWPEIARLAREGDRGAQQAQFLADLEG